MNMQLQAHPERARTPSHTDVRRAESIAHGVARQVRRSHDLYDDLYGSAMLAFVECSARFETDRDTPLTGYAAARMRGSAFDLLRREQRLRRIAQLHNEALEHSAGTVVDTAPLRNKVDVHHLVERTRRDLPADEAAVLHEVYLSGRQLHEVCQDRGWSRSQGIRRHRDLLVRLRRELGLELDGDCDEASEIQGERASTHRLRGEASAADASARPHHL